MPVVDDKHSDELVFSNFDYPLYLHPYMELRVWFGEDLKNWSESGLDSKSQINVWNIFKGEAAWYKINQDYHTVYFEARNNRPGHVTYRGAQGMLVDALKLVYKSGEVRCWVCHGYSSFKGYPLNVVITDRQDNLIFPYSSL